MNTDGQFTKKPGNVYKTGNTAVVNLWWLERLVKKKD